MAGWNLRHGRWWMVQWSLDGWLSLGVHVDFRHRRDAAGRRYGPYLDIHLLCFILSLGFHPTYSGDIDKLIGSSRGGL